MNSDQTPISMQDLVAFVVGEADAATIAHVRLTVQADPSVTHTVQQIEMMLATLKEGVFEPAPAVLKKAASELWRSIQTPTLAQWLGTLVESTLSIAFDSRQTPEIAGFRGEQTGHHMTFSNSIAEIDVLIEHDGDTCIMRGHVAGVSADSVATIGEYGQVLASSSVGADGAFSLALSPLARDLCVKSGSGAFRLRGVQ